MIKIEYKKNIIPEIEALAKLYNNVEWYNYTKDLKVLKKAFENSLLIISAWDKDNLVGLLRAVGDGQTIMYIQDILINKQYQRQGIGSQLMKSFMDEYGHIRQKVLLTDNEEATISFYKSCGFVTTDSYNAVAFINYAK